MTTARKDDDDQSDELDQEGPSEQDIRDLDADEATATRKCPSCGTDMYEDAIKCVACGQYVGSRISRWVVWVILIMLATGAAAMVIELLK